MFQYALNWKRLNQIRYPCYLAIPRSLLLRLYLFISLQSFLFCFLPLPFIWLLCMLPVAGIIVYQLVVWLRVYKGFGYSVWPPIVLQIIWCLLTFGFKQFLRFEVL